MSKMKFGLTAVVLSGLGLISGLSTSTAHAQSDQGAVVYHACPAELGELTIDGYDFQYCFDLTATPSGNGNGSFHGELLDLSTAPAKTVTVTGFPCWAGFGVTYETKLTITPSGQIHGSCESHGNS